MGWKDSARIGAGVVHAVGQLQVEFVEQGGNIRHQGVEQHEQGDGLSRAVKLFAHPGGYFPGSLCRAFRTGLQILMQRNIRHGVEKQQPDALTEKLPILD
jgi:hypothetical protein